MSDFRTDHCLKAALNLLARRDHSCEELRRKLKKRGYPREQIIATVSECRRMNYLDDKRFALGCLRNYRRRGHGYHRIHHLMKSKGLSDSLIDATLEKHYPQQEQYADCCVALEKKIRKTVHQGAGPPSADKLYRFLFQRGFPGSIILETFKDRDVSENNGPEG